jgi:hypothetical protein
MSWHEQAAQLPTDQLQYMRRTADMGRRKETQKQRLRRELMEEKAGLPVPADSRLHQKVTCTEVPICEYGGE